MQRVPNSQGRETVVIPISVRPRPLTAAGGSSAVGRKEFDNYKESSLSLPRARQISEKVPLIVQTTDYVLYHTTLHYIE